ncbi:hypothetical protein R1sor_007698 [Riccia sorocarpa]|uniref:Uncharacterized protein n=1 Tax=Riccia sorocarpa TaxID=122646 RepID=A0ABD3HUP0_9MARC
MELMIAENICYSCKLIELHLCGRFPGTREHPNESSEIKSSCIPEEIEGSTKMGNFASCVTPDMGKLSVKVVQPDGKVQEYRRSVVVAELMMEHPNHFVIHSSSLTNINKKSMLSAEIELESGRLYYLLPYDKFQGILAPETNEAPGNKPARAVNALQQLAQAKFEIQQKQSLENPMLTTRVPGKGEDFLMSADTGVGGGRRSSTGSNPNLRELYSTQHLMKTNSWKPKLETIREVVAVSRSKKQRVHNLDETTSEEESRSESAVASAVASPKASFKEAAVVPIMSSPPRVFTAPGSVGVAPPNQTRKIPRGEKNSKNPVSKKMGREQQQQPQPAKAQGTPQGYSELFPVVVQCPPRRMQAVN